MKKSFTSVCSIFLVFMLTITLISPMFIYAADGATVVYLKDGGTGDGSSPDQALGTLNKAYDILDLSKDCTIVICGTFTQELNFSYGLNYAGSVTFTSVYNGVDYRTNGAVYQFAACRFVCFGDTRFENLDFQALGSYFLVVGQHHPVTIGEGVVITGDESKLTGGSIAKAFTILGGYQNGQDDPPFESDADTNITVLSGSKLYIVPFSRQILGTYTGTAHIKIGGNADISVLHGSSAYPDGIAVGDVKIEISGDAKIQNFYGCTQDTVENSFELIWKSGTIDVFEWVCSYTPGKLFMVTEKTELKASDEVKKQENYNAISANFDVVSDLSETASSEDSDLECAQGLFALGLAQGYDTTGINFGLEDQLTRVQAVVQVIRYLGVEDEVKTNTYDMPFTDVPEWAANYVGYAYEKGITQGRSDVSYDPDGIVSEAQFLTFMLRAIGYSDSAGDFVWDNPFALSKSIGMISNDTGGEAFLRGDAFRICWNSLFAAAKDGQRVTDHLIAAGVFTADELEAVSK